MMFGAVPGSNKELDMLLELTGYVYLDIESFIDISNEDMREELFSHKFIVGVWLSFGGKGFGALAYCPELIFQRYNQHAYRQCYTAISDYLVRHSGIRLTMDEKCKNPNRQTAISYDPLALYRRDYKGFGFTYHPELKKEKEYFGKAGDKYAGIEVDPDLIFSIEQARQFEFLIDRYIYYPYIVLDRNTGKPIKWDDRQLSASGDYELVRYVSKEVIRGYEFRNEECTMANLPEGCHKVVLKLDGDRYFEFGSRADSIKAVTLTLLGIRKLTEGILHSKNEIYHIIYQLNKKCVRSLPKRPASPQASSSFLNSEEDQFLAPPLDETNCSVIDYYRLDDRELNLLTSQVWDIYNSDSLLLKTEEAKEIISVDFFKTYENKSGKRARTTREQKSARLTVRNPISSRVRSTEWMKMLEKLHTDNPVTSYKSAIDALLSQPSTAANGNIRKCITERSAQMRIRRFREYWMECVTKDAISHKENPGTEDPYPCYKFMEDSFRYYPFSSGKPIEEYVVKSHTHTPSSSPEVEKNFRKQIKHAIDTLFVSGMKIRQKNVAKLLGVSAKRLSRYWEPFKELVAEKNSMLSSGNGQPNAKANSRKIIADAIDRYDPHERIDQKRISVYTGLSMRTVAGYWSEFKKNISEHNTNVKGRKGTMASDCRNRTKKMLRPILFYDDEAAKPVPPKAEDRKTEKPGESKPVKNIIDLLNEDAVCDSASVGIPKTTKQEYSFEDRYKPKKFDHEANDKLFEKISKTIREFEVEYARRNP